jgi:hypothetical protein
MIMNGRFTGQLTSVAASLLLSVVPGTAQSGKATLAVSTIQPLPALSAAMAASGKANSLSRVVEAYDSQLMDRLNAGRKFEIVGRSDLPSIVREQELAGSGNVATGDPNAAQPGKLAGARYLLVATVDDFDDTTSKIELPNLDKVALKRKIRLSTTAKIYDAGTGSLLESTSVQLEQTDDRMDPAVLQRNAEPSDALLLEITRAAAQEIATRVADLVFPVRVLARRETQVTINRGAGAGVESGQLFNVFAEGEELVDPDTLEVLGREEILIGKVRVISVQPRLSTALIVEDFGIDKGAVLRPATGD